MALVGSEWCQIDDDVLLVKELVEFGGGGELCLYFVALRRVSLT